MIALWVKQHFWNTTEPLNAKQHCWQNCKSWYSRESLLAPEDQLSTNNQEPPETIHARDPWSPNKCSPATLRTKYKRNTNEIPQATSFLRHNIFSWLQNSGPLKLQLLRSEMAPGCWIEGEVVYSSTSCFAEEEHSPDVMSWLIPSTEIVAFAIGLPWRSLTNPFTPRWI